MPACRSSIPKGTSATVPAIAQTILTVTSHPPRRNNQLKDLFAGSTVGLVFVTTFLDRSAMREYLPQIAWETEVWVADAPDHFIHFNGERFLGPYENNE